MVVVVVVLVVLQLEIDTYVPRDVSVRTVIISQKGTTGMVVENIRNGRVWIVQKANL